MATKQHVLRLYKNIMKLHHKVLSPEMKVLGDSYVRDEFKRHKSATSEFVPQFIQAWEQYHQQMIEKESHSKVGKPIASDAFDALSDEQLEKIQDLKESATQVGQLFQKKNKD